ncbi:MAG: hypothetical protein WCX30_03270 [Candidatus Paceibacterota bacterium]|jgi:hypothetical protein|nr:hypothetical protein [bacterium]
MTIKKIKKEYIVFTIILIVVAGGFFYGGMKYQEGKNGARFAQMLNGQMQNGQKQGTAGQVTNRQKGGLVGGEILSKDDKSIVLKDRSGGSKIVFFSQSTQFLKSTTGSIDDISVGSNITVTGDQNSDGSVTAKIIQISSQSLMPTGSQGPGQNQPTTK